MFIDGFSLSGYRSFGNETQRVGPFGKVNLLAGQNNSGKSNILLFIKRNFPLLLNATREHGAAISAEELDQHRGNTVTNKNFGIGLNLSGPNYDAIIRKCNEGFKILPANYGQGDFEFALGLVDQILHSDALSQSGNTAWFTYSPPASSNGIYELSQELVSSIYQELVHVNREGAINHTWIALDYSRSRSYSGLGYEEMLRRILNFIAPHNLPVPDIHLIPAIRQIGESGSTYEDFSGFGIIKRLHELQSPGYNDQHLKVNFQTINTFLKNITGNQTANLEVPHDQKMIIVHMDNKSLPLSSLGTGIHEMIILATAATVVENQIICIEEPELHLHPLLQRKLVRYLQDNTTNQYFLTTHSAHILDSTDMHVFHVRHQEGVSTVDPVSTSLKRAEVCADLGYRASDLIQANSVIWVEGPSDRIYISHWIKNFAPELIEGLHYSIMFYGGRLLSHLSADDPEVNDFISLRRLNRYIAIVIDSDKDKATKKLNETKIRLKQEFDRGPGFAWITKGREIENYVESTLLEESVKTVHRSAARLDKTGQFDHCYFFRNAKNELKEGVDKIGVAREVTKSSADLSTLDLQKQVEKLVTFIRQANDL